MDRELYRGESEAERGVSRIDQDKERAITTLVMYNHTVHADH